MKSEFEKSIAKAKKVLIYGIGNPVRGDDGLGIYFTDALKKHREKLQFAHMDIAQNYQLNIEDALLIGEYDLVLFVDASYKHINNFMFKKVQSENPGFSMHAFSPGMLLQLAKLYNEVLPEVWELHLPGFQWGYGEFISKKAKNHLFKALDFLLKHIKNLQAV